jgi:hypothetical protein
MAMQDKSKPAGPALALAIAMAANAIGANKKAARCLDTCF